MRSTFLGIDSEGSVMTSWALDTLLLAPSLVASTSSLEVSSQVMPSLIIFRVSLRAARVYCVKNKNRVKNNASSIT